MPEELDAGEVQRRYAAGETLRDLAASYGVAVDTVRRRLPEVRPTGRPSRGDLDSAEIVRLHDEEGLSFRRIGERLGADKTTVSRRYRAAGTIGDRPA